MQIFLCKLWAACKVVKIFKSWLNKETWPMSTLELYFKSSLFGQNLLNNLDIENTTFVSDVQVKEYMLC